MGENGIILEHHADIPFVGLQVIDNLVVKADFSAVHAVKPAIILSSVVLPHPEGPNSVKIRPVLSPDSLPLTL